MTERRIDGVRRTALMLVGMVALATGAGAQSAVGAGPLTSTLAETEPTAGVLSMGLVKLAPGLVIREIGWDSNVFDETEAEGPKDDFVLAAMPDVAMFSRLRFFKLSAYAGSELNYYRQYQSEQSIGHAVRGRVDLLLSRVRPFVGGGQTKTRTRPNGEITARANRKEEELSGGIAFELGAHSSVYGTTIRTKSSFRDAFEENVDLGRSLTREGVEYSGGIRTDLTPLAALTVTAGVREDTFRFLPLRNADSRIASATLKIDAAAVVTGSVMVGFNDFKAVDPKVKPFRGLTGSAVLAYSLLEVGRLALIATRRQEYSFDAAEAYYLENAISLVYNHRLFGAVDAQVRGSRAVYDYGFYEATPPHTDTLDTVEGGVGYNLRNRTRVSLNYEYARRRSPALADRNYNRRRAFLAWNFAF